MTLKWSFVGSEDPAVTTGQSEWRIGERVIRIESIEYRDASDIQRFMLALEEVAEKRAANLVLERTESMVRNRYGVLK